MPFFIFLHLLTLPTIPKYNEISLRLHANWHTQQKNERYPNGIEYPFAFHLTRQRQFPTFSNASILGSMHDTLLQGGSSYNWLNTTAKACRDGVAIYSWLAYLTNAPELHLASEWHKLRTASHSRSVTNEFIIKSPSHRHCALTPRTMTVEENPASDQLFPSPIPVPTYPYQFLFRRWQK